MRHWKRKFKCLLSAVSFGASRGPGPPSLLESVCMCVFSHTVALKYAITVTRRKKEAQPVLMPLTHFTRPLIIYLFILLLAENLCHVHQPWGRMMKRREKKNMASVSWIHYNVCETTADKSHFPAPPLTLFVNKPCFYLVFYLICRIIFHDTNKPHLVLRGAGISDSLL